MSDSHISIRGLYKIFGKRPASALTKVHAGVEKDALLNDHGHVLGLQDINLEIPRKKIQVIMGLSGSGKSTLIRHFNRLIEPTAGEVWVDGQNVLALNKPELMQFRREKMSMVFQRFALLPHRTIIENVRYGLDIQGVSDDDAKARAIHWIERVGLAGQEDQYPGQLSGGMQQRVGLARALATDADILLMDEAFSALDPLIRTEMQNILLELQRELHKTIVFITHDLDEALKLGDNIAILRDGAIVQTGAPEDIVLKPADDYVADFMKDINRARVLTLASMVRPDGDAVLELPVATTLEDACLALCDEPTGQARVIDEDGNFKGYVELHDLIRAQARPNVASFDI
ncbi:quaternary amine ABC transporter ATP-binding protein [Litorivicinus lipolyticus]|uniref:quaternary amine ABC transporter ATP-binding protein n=1 Tax=Litorivicinus lipolyticus TaxID=418701 RepID=UPI003B59FD99